MADYTIIIKLQCTGQSPNCFFPMYSVDVLQGNCFVLNSCLEYPVKSEEELGQCWRATLAFP